MTQTDRLKLPLIETHQAQKHITHNEALRIVDAFLHLTLETLEQNNPPETPEVGQCWQIGEAPTGIWNGKAGKIASYDVNGWQFLQPTNGMIAWVKPLAELFVYTASSWTRFEQAPTALHNVEQVGIGTTADPHNKLAVKSESAFLSSLDDGSGDARFGINKSAPSNTASMNFKTAWSGRAEIGLTGSDALAIKVSGDGAAWTTAAEFSSENGELFLPVGLSANSRGVTQKLNSIVDCGRFADEKTKQVSTFVPPNYLTMENGATISEHAKFQFDSVDYGGANAANDVTVKQLLDQIREAPAARYFAEFFVAKLVAGAGTEYENIQAGGSKYRICSYDRIGGNKQTIGAYFYVSSGSALVSASNHEVWLNGTNVTDYAELAARDGWQHINAISDFSARYASHQVSELFPIFATSGVEILLALPAIIPDAVRIDPMDGLIPAIGLAG